MRTSRRILLLGLVLLLVMLVPLGATAGTKPGSSPTPAEYRYVTMGLLGSQGLATGCPPYNPADPDDHRIEIQQAPTNTRYVAGEGYGDSEWPILDIEAAISWSREYPKPDGLSGQGLIGCQGTYVVDGSVPYTPLLLINTDRTGRPVSLVWHFNRYAEEQWRGNRLVTRLLEGFDLISGDDFACLGSNPYSCSGLFTLDRLSPDGTETQGDAHLEFTLLFSAT